jgi:hypothetical protein
MPSVEFAQASARKGVNQVKAHITRKKEHFEHNFFTTGRTVLSKL